MAFLDQGQGTMYILTLSVFAVAVAALVWVVLGDDGALFSPIQSQITIPEFAFLIANDTNGANVTANRADDTIHFTAGDGMDIDMNFTTQTVTFNSTGVNVDCTALGGDVDICAGDQDYRGLTAGAGITLVENANDIQITSTVGGGGGSGTNATGTASFVVFQNSTNHVFARNGTSGVIDFDNADFGTLISTLSDLTTVKIHVTAGTYNVTSGNRIVLNDNDVWLEGAGTGITTFLAEDGLENRVIHFNAGSNIKISDFSIDGNSDGQSSNNADCLNANGGERITIENVEAFDCFNIGFNIQNSPEITIRESYVHDTSSDGNISTCIRIQDSEQGLMESNKVENCGVDANFVCNSTVCGDGNGIWSNNSDNIKYIGNAGNNTARDTFTIQNTVGGVMSGNTVDLTFDSCYTISNGANVAVTGNVGINCGGTGFFASDVSEVSYVNNLINGCGTNVSWREGSGFTLTGSSGSSNIRISDNVVLDDIGTNGCDFGIRMRAFNIFNVTMVDNDFNGVIMNATHGWLHDLSTAAEADKNYQIWGNTPIHPAAEDNRVLQPTQFFANIDMQTNSIEGSMGCSDNQILDYDLATDTWSCVDNSLGNHTATQNLDMNDFQLISAKLQNSATPPETCGASFYGMIWHDTDTGITYVCDSSRDKWLSLGTTHIMGGESANCAAGTSLGTDGCTIDVGTMSTLSTNRGFYLPHNATVTGYGLSMLNDDCVTGTYSVELWGSSGPADDGPADNQHDIVTGLTGELSNSNSLDVDIMGDAYFVLGLDNDCGESINNFLINIFLKWRPE